MPQKITPKWRRSDFSYRLRYSSCQIQMVFSSTIVLWALGPSFSNLPSELLCGLLTETDRLTQPELKIQKQIIIQ